MSQILSYSYSALIPPPHNVGFLLSCPLPNASYVYIIMPCPIALQRLRWPFGERVVSSTKFLLLSALINTADSCSFVAEVAPPHKVFGIQRSRPSARTRVRLRPLPEVHYSQNLLRDHLTFLKCDRRGTQSRAYAHNFTRTTLLW